MPRAPRREEAGAIHHVFARGIAKREIYVDDDDRRLYLRLLERAVERQRWRCLAYCLMGNHVHLLIQTPEPNLGRGMQFLHGDYAAAFNNRHGRSGHVFQGRYKNVRITDDAHLLVAAAYIANNPVEAELCVRPDEWDWGSHQAVVDRTSPPWLATGLLLEYFGALGGDARRRYVTFVTGRPLEREGKEDPRDRAWALPSGGWT